MKHLRDDTRVIETHQYTKKKKGKKKKETSYVAMELPVATPSVADVVSYFTIPYPTAFTPGLIFSLSNRFSWESDFSLDATKPLARLMMVPVLVLRWSAVRAATPLRWSSSFSTHVPHHSPTSLARITGERRI